MFGLKAKKIDVRQEKEAYIGQSRKILALLQTKEVVYTYELERIAFNYTMRISELRKKGWSIVSTYERRGVWAYTLLGNKNDGE